MKFIHIADVHLGAVPDSNQPWGSLREKEIWDSFQHIIDICNKEKADLLLIAGDMFHKQPLLRELKEANYYLSKLVTAKAVIMAGNHDYIGPRSYYQDFVWDEKVHMFLNDTIESFEFPELGAEVYGLSYRSRDITEPLYDSVRPNQMNKINILLAHGGEEKNIPMNRKKLMDSGFDYIALGHIHKPEIINERMAYPGSMEPVDKNETGERGYILGVIDEEQGQRKTSIRFVPTSVREYKRVKLTATQETTNGSLLDQARDIMRAAGEQHIYSFCILGIRDEFIHFDKEALKSLGNVLEVEDESVPDYDFDALYKENADNMIGLFIQRIRENTKQDEIAKKALYYGIEALLGAKN
ncbi:MAG TPA: DNA repair exonuclease [Mobilitalea sp.]|nr:DNA repair exonuclease [Mobilitalea sp.]